MDCGGIFAKKGKLRIFETGNINHTAMLRLNVFIRTTESARAELIETARKLTAASLRDRGCVDYDLYESATRPDVLMICETWQDEAALAEHARQPHFTTLVPRLRELGEMTTERFGF